MRSEMTSLKNRALAAALQTAYRLACDQQAETALREHRRQCVTDMLESAGEDLAALVVHAAAAPENAAFFKTLSAAAEQEGLFLSQRRPSAEDAPGDVRHMMEDVLRPHHRSLFWGDRLCTLDKAAAFLNDPDFAALLESLRGKHQYDQYDGPQGIAWRLAVLAWAARRALRLPGDFVECGVFEGDMSFFLVSLLDFGSTDKRFFLYDSFEGFDLSRTDRSDYPLNEGFLDFAHKIYRERSVYENAVSRFAPWENVRVVKGFLPAALETTCPEKIAYLHIDLNAPQAELGVLERLFPRMTPGGVIVFDDYGWLEFVRQREAEDAFMRERGHEILELPTGQGLVVVS